MKIKFQNFQNFTQILQKGCVLRFANYQFNPKDTKKARWVIVLNNFPPKKETDRVIFVPLRSNWKTALFFCQDNLDVNVIKDKKILVTKDGKSAYDLAKIDGMEAQFLYDRYRSNELSYKGCIDKTEFNRINSHIKKFFSRSPSVKIIPTNYKKIIYP